MGATLYNICRISTVKVYGKSASYILYIIAFLACIDHKDYKKPVSIFSFIGGVKIQDGRHMSPKIF